MLRESSGAPAHIESNEHLSVYVPERQSASPIPWIETVKGVPYFVDDRGDDWTPIGQNDAITWPDLAGAFRRRNLAGVEAYLNMLAQHGVTCLRLMLEYCQGEHRYLERPAGHFQPNMVRLWDDIFALCEKHGLRILLTPYDTFWMWLRWSHHPYQRVRGGPCAKRSQWLLCRDTRAAIKNRLAFATERWGGSGALFAWDIWNEIHPAHAEDSADCFAEFVQDVSDFLRKKELHLHGRAHPQTVSVFTPALGNGALVADCAFRHPALDFASTHFYESGTIDHPSNTVDPAISTGRLTREALAQIKDQRPFFDSEHGPIHTFKDHRKTLPEPFDDEYFRHMQWAHFASGSAGGGMRWPNRHPHTLTKGMRAAQSALARFLPLVDWQRFRRRNLNDEIGLSDPALAAFACGDEEQVIAWLLRTDEVGRDGTLRKDVEPRPVRPDVPGLRPGRYRVTTWDTVSGETAATFEVDHPQGDRLRLPVLQVRTDLALSISRLAT
jgi:mannan endo-1,4-beta-mannosidase